MFIEWAESMLVHGEGDLLGEPYRVPEWGKRAAWRIFEYDPNHLVRVGGIVACAYIVARVLIICPKGSAKTEFIAALMLFLLAGPSLPTPDGPVMRRSPNLPVAAGSWDQADKLFGDAAKQMATGTEDAPAPLAPFVECFDTEILLTEGRGKLYRVAAVAGTNDGGLPTAGAADEIHEWDSPRKRRVHLVLFQGMEKRANCLELNITTPDDADPESLLGIMVADGEKIATGEGVWKIVRDGLTGIAVGLGAILAVKARSASRLVWENNVGFGGCCGGGARMPLIHLPISLGVGLARPSLAAHVHISQNRRPNSRTSSGVYGGSALASFDSILPMSPPSVDGSHPDSSAMASNSGRLGLGGFGGATAGGGSGAEATTTTGVGSGSPLTSEPGFAGSTSGGFGSAFGKEVFFPLGSWFWVLGFVVRADAVLPFCCPDGLTLRPRGLSFRESSSVRDDHSTPSGALPRRCIRFFA